MKPLDDITILVAEDERAVRMLIRVVLETAGARVVDAEDGVQALRLLDLHDSVGLLCTDVNMPNLDGTELVAETRRRRPRLPIVACTALDLEGHASTLASEVDGLVQKPFVPSELVRAIEDALAGHRSHPVA
jgi:CheY-like chemotaxis protein